MKKGRLRGLEAELGRCRGAAKTAVEQREARIARAEYLIKAGRHQEALREVEAEPAGSGSGDKLSIRLLLVRGSAQSGLGNRAAARAALLLAGQESKGQNLKNLEAAAAMRMYALEQGAERQTAQLRVALAVAQAGGAAYEEMDIRSVMGFVLMRGERYSEAVEWLETAIPLAEASDAERHVQRSLGNLGWCYYKLGEDGLAIETSRRAAQMAAEAEEWSDLSQWQNTIGNALVAQRRFPAAVESFRQALATAEKANNPQRLATAWNNLSVTKLLAGDFSGARASHQQAVAWRRGSGEAALFSALTESHILIGEKNFVAAEKLVKTSLQSPAITPTLRRGFQAAMASCHRQAGRKVEAERQFRAVLREIEEKRETAGREEFRLSLSSAMNAYYREYVEFLLAEKRAGEALLVSDVSRRDSMEERVGSAAAPISKQAKTISAQAIARRHEAVILIYWLQPKQSWVWVVTADKVAAKPLAGEEEIERLIAEHAREIEDPIRRGRKAGTQLYERLVAPALDDPGELERPRRVILIGDGALHRLNFETLPAGGEPGRYWLEEAMVTRAVSLGSLAGAPIAKPANEKLLVVGNPQLAGTNFAPLPRSGEEVKAIAAMFSGRNPVSLTGAAATVEGYLGEPLEEFSYIHFSTHGVASEARPLDSALILSPSRGGVRLEARMILERKLRARMVSLAACESAGKRAYRGSGLVGLAWAFLRAGAGAVVAGLWEVNDSASLEIHTSLYQQIRAGRTAAVALREAKLSLLRSPSPLRSPYYWGSLVLIEGNP